METQCVCSMIVNGIEVTQKNAHHFEMNRPFRPVWITPIGPLVYVIMDERTGVYKIGYTAQEMEKRITSLYSEYHPHLRCVATIPVWDIQDEQYAHGLLRTCNFRNTKGEWFALPRDFNTFFYLFVLDMLTNGRVRVPPIIISDYFFRINPDYAAAYTPRQTRSE